MQSHHGKALLWVLLYCGAFYALRVALSSTMELDEAEQFLLVQGPLRWGYPREAPLFTWLLWGLSRLFPPGLHLVLALKYGAMAAFLLGVYALLRLYLPPREALWGSAAVLLFPTYSYEFNRHLSNTVLLAASATWCTWAYLRLLRRPSYGGAALLGMLLALGLCSKYNFVFLLAALALATVASRAGRELLRRHPGKVLLSLLVALSVLSPHLSWLLGHGAPSVGHALRRAEAGQGQFLQALGSWASELTLFVLLGRLLSPSRGKAPEPLGWLLAGGLLSPLLLSLVLQSRLSSKWLAPFFLLPLWWFSRRPPSRAVALAALAVALGVFALRALVGLAPGLTGKLERIHLPARALAEELRQRIEPSSLLVIQDGHLRANLMAHWPEAGIVPYEKARVLRALREGKRVYLLWPASSAPPAGLPPGKRPVHLRVPYLRSQELYGVALLELRPEGGEVR